MAYQQAQGRAEQSVWVGTVEDLKSLVGQVDELAKHVRDKRVTLANASKEARRDAYMKRRAYQLSESQQLAEFEEEERRNARQLDAEAELSMTINFHRWSLSYGGTPEEVFEKPIDVKDIRNVVIALKGGAFSTLDGYGLSVTLGENGANASIKAPESHFIDLAATRMQGEFKRQRPWYWWFRTPWVLIPIALPTVLIAPFVFSNTGPNGVYVFGGITFLTVFLSVSMTIGYFATRLLVRPFELVKEGFKGRSARQIAIIAALIVWLISNVLTPIVLDSVKFTVPTPRPSSSVTGDL